MIYGAITPPVFTASYSGFVGGQTVANLGGTLVFTVKTLPLPGVAQAVNSRDSAFSLGCAGMRTFTEIPPELSLLVIPSATLPALAADLRQIQGANTKMLDYYKAKQRAFA